MGAFDQEFPSFNGDGFSSQTPAQNIIAPFQKRDRPNMFPLTIAWPTQTTQAVTVALYLILALSVTADVLLKKSDVRSALGWIAAAWLSPIFGSLLYYMFGINRVTRRALKLRRPDEKRARG